MARKQKTCGVYKITSPSNRIYIGSSICIEDRFCYYKNNNLKNQWLLKRSFEKYGVEKHNFEILEICEPDKRLIREYFWGNYYQSLSDFGGLNLKLPKINDLPNSISTLTRNKLSYRKLGTKASIETKNKISKSKKKYFQNNVHHLSKLILNQETGIFYDSVKDAAKSINVKRTCLSMRLLGYNKNNTKFIYV